VFADTVVLFKTFVSKSMDTCVASVMFRTKPNDGCGITSPSETTNVMDFARCGSVL
jgi:hypothetical protein